MFFLMTIMAGPVAGLGAALGKKAGTLPVIGFTVGGLVLGVALAAASHALVYREWNRASDGLKFFLYLLIPPLCFAATIAVPLLVAVFVYK
jgi:hypothetical protein